MQDGLEKLLRKVEPPDWESIQRRWEEYRQGADSQDPSVRSAADSAFASLLAWYGSALYRHIWGFIRSDAAEDILQEVLRKLHENRLDPRLSLFQANVLPWLRTVAIRQCVDAHRRAVRRRGRESRVARPLGVMPEESPGELSELLVVALARLPTRLQQAVAVYYFEGLDRKQAAAALGIHRDTLATRLQAALRRLRKQLTNPVAIAFGTEAAIAQALAACPRGPSPERLTELAAGARSTAVPLTTGLKLAIGLVSTSLVMVGAVAAGWILTRESDPRTPDGGVSQVRQESLQEMNKRLTREEIVPILLKESQKLVPPDNPLRLEDVRAYGSEVECEFRVERPVIPSWKPLGLRLRYCTLMRHMEVLADVKGDGAWKPINPERPIIIDLAIPGLPVPAVDLAKDRVDIAKAAFDRLPRDNRAESEKIRHLFATDSGAFVLPAGIRGLSASEGRLFLVDVSFGLFMRKPQGEWRFVGECPGWWLTANGTRLFCIRGDEIWIKPSLDRDVAWVRWSKLPPPRPEERYEFLAVSGDRLFVVIQPGGLISRPLSGSRETWEREVRPSPLWPTGLAGTTDRLFGNDSRRILMRMKEKEEWTPVAPWPDRCEYLVIDGDRMLACGGSPGPVHSRPLSAAPEAAWEVAGQVLIPQR